LITAIYCRLSKEDSDTVSDSHNESESIQNQKSLLIKYAVEKGWDIYNIYCDEDYSGADRERPAFKQLIEEAEQGKFNVVLVKTQSRFTRDMELVERYIHGKFLEWGIRFVAMVDNIDTDVKGNKKARQINGLINEWYLEDLSENIRTVFDHKRKSGKYIGGFPVYGYKKDPNDKNHLIIDHDAAEVVKRIYMLYLSGNGKQHIAYVLNSEAVPNPTKYKQIAGSGYKNGAQRNDLGLWNRTSVGRILREQIYTGDMVQGRSKKVSYKSNRIVPLPRDEWIIVPDTHEAIIDKAVFATVNRLMNERTKSSGLGQVHLLAGKVKCLDCGSTMTKISSSSKPNRKSYLRCKLYTTDKTRCTNHAIRLDVLESQVVTLLRQYIEQYYDRSSAEKLISGSDSENKKGVIHSEINNLSSEMERRGKAMRDLYLDKSGGIIDEEQFAEMNRGYLSEKIHMQKRLSFLEDQLAEIESRFVDKESFRIKIEQLLDVTELSRELVADFINTVEVGERNPENGHQIVRINWLF